MTEKLTEILAECSPCKKETQHTYLGDYGIPQKPVYVYSCKECHHQFQSSVKLGGEE